MYFFVTVLILTVAAAVVIITAKAIATHKFKCKHCSGEFSIHWSKVFTTVHSDNEYMLECPFCNTKDWCIAQKKDTHGQ